MKFLHKIAAAKAVCENCEGTGIWLTTELDHTFRVECCDLCGKFKTDQAAFDALNKLVYKKKPKNKKKK